MNQLPDTTTVPRFSAMDRATLSLEIKTLIVKVANLKGTLPTDIDDNVPLFQAGLGLDSIDILELVVNLEKRYGIKLRNDDSGQHALRNVANLTETTLAFINLGTAAF